MKLFAVITTASLLVAGSAFAADTTAPASTTAMSSTKASCTKSATDQGLKGKAKKSAIHKCMKAAK